MASDALALLAERRFALQLLEQVVTSSQHLSHFFRHVKGRSQTTHTFQVGGKRGRVSGSDHWLPHCLHMHAQTTQS